MSTTSDIPGNDTNTITDALPDLVQSFNNLLINTSGDTAMLNKYQDMLSAELERVSNTGSASLFSDQVDDTDSTSESVPAAADETTNENQRLIDLVTYLPSFMSSDFLLDIKVSDEIIGLFSWTNHKYIWLADSDIPYSFGGKSFNPQPLSNTTAISSIMN